MKTLITSLVLLIGVLTSCEKKDNNDIIKSLHGKWVNDADNNEYIEFLTDNDVVVNGYDFDYVVDNDSIKFQYSGNYFVLCLEESLKFEIDNNQQILKIEDINKLCLVSGNDGITVYNRELQQ